MWQVKNIYVVHSFRFFLCSEISCPCFYFNSNCLILFIMLFSAKDSLIFMMNSFLFFKFSSTSLSQLKSKQKVLGCLITIIFSSMIIMTWLNWYKLFSGFIMLMQKYGISLISNVNLHELFPGFIHANNIGSVVNGLSCVKKFLILFLLLLLHHLQVVACQINRHIFLYHSNFFISRFFFIRPATIIIAYKK